MSSVLGVSPNPSTYPLPGANPSLVGWGRTGSPGVTRALGAAQKGTPGTRVSGSLTTGVEFFQHFNTQYGLAAVYRVTVSSACSLPQNSKSFRFFFFF